MRWRATRRSAERGPPPAILVGAFLAVGFLLVVGISGVGDARRSGQSRRAQLVELVEERRAQVDSLGAELRELRGEVRSAEDDVSSGTARRSRERERARRAAGITPMEGAGVVVTLDDSDLVTADPAERRALRILDVDLQAVTNALWRAGAEAVAVGDARVVSITSIRGAGATITVNFRPVAPPYEVRAIGAEAADVERSAVADRFATWSELFGFRFEIRPSDEVTVPGYSGPTRLTSARRAEADAGRATDPGPEGGEG